MKNKIELLVRPEVRQLEPYASARGLYAQGTLLDANENSLGSALGDAGRKYKLNRYPDPLATELREAIARYARCGPESIFVGNGSDEIIDLLVRAFASPGENVAVLKPTYGMYVVCAKANGLNVKEVELDGNFQPDVQAIRRAVDGKTKIIFVCSPNNPTGNCIDEDAIEALAKTGRLVVVDEAYAEFSRRSIAKLVKKYENLVILRTFSKAWGLAGLRVGYAIADEQAIRYLRKIKLPYNVNAVSQKLALRALKNEGRMRAMVQKIVEGRERIRGGLEGLGLEVLPSDANFLLVRLPEAVSAQKVQKKLAEGSVIVRDRSSAVANSIRITVGTGRQNRLALEKLRRALLGAVDAIIFDIDGVLVDVSRSYRLAIKQTAEKFTGRKIPKGEIEKLKSKPGFNNDWDVTYALVKGVKKVGAKERASRKYGEMKGVFQELYMNRFARNERPIIKEKTLEKLGKFRLGVVTSRPRAEAIAALRDFMPKYFSDKALVALEDCAEEKPSPGPLLLAKNRIGARFPLYVGDNVSDALAARGAGMPCIMVGKRGMLGVRSVNEVPRLLEVGK